MQNLRISYEKKSKLNNSKLSGYALHQFLKKNQIQKSKLNTIEKDFDNTSSFEVLP